MVLLLLIYYLLLFSLFVGVLCLVLVLLFSTLRPSSFAVILMGEERADCFVLTVFLMSCDNQCSMALPHGAVGWSAAWYCGISCSLAF